MKTSILFLIIWLFLVPYQTQSSERHDSYQFELSVVDSKNGRIDFDYVNKSKVAHCIRYEDLNFIFVEDSMYVRDEANMPIEYIGPKGKSTLTPKEYIFLPPGDKIGKTLYLKNLYKIKNRNFIVSFSVPVIPCERLLLQLVEIPPLGFLKNRVNDPSATHTDIFAKDYPEWTQFGFIAISNSLLVKRR